MLDRYIGRFRRKRCSAASSARRPHQRLRPCKVRSWFVPSVPRALLTCLLGYGKGKHSIDSGAVGAHACTDSPLKPLSEFAPARIAPKFHDAALQHVAKGVPLPVIAAAKRDVPVAPNHQHAPGRPAHSQLRSDSFGVSHIQQHSPDVHQSPQALPVEDSRPATAYCLDAVFPVRATSA